MKLSRLLFLPIILFAMSACKDTNEKKESSQTADAGHKNTIVQKPFVVLGTDSITQYTLTNGNGVSVSIINYGGTVTNIMVPDKNGTMGDVVLGFDDLNGYLNPKNPYFGALIGRYANRIANATFTLDGKTYSLAPNNNGNTLHGGIKGFDKCVWQATVLPGDSSIQLTYRSKDMEEGYPGNLEISVVYGLTNQNELVIDYKATSDKPTPANFTNHSYFNLSAGKDSTVLDHDLVLSADQYTPVNDKLIPLGKHEAVKGGPMDFLTRKRIGKEIDAVPGGYDHNWVLNKTDNSLTLVGTLYHAASGRTMEVLTTEPGMQFYSGNFLDGSLTGKGGKRYVKHGGLSLEAQHFPDSPNQTSFPSTILKPGETYKQTTVYRFGVQ